MGQVTSKRRWVLSFLLGLFLVSVIPGWAAGERCACPDEIELAWGLQGRMFAELQRFLKNENLYFHEISGVFDAETREAVNSFQRKNGLPVTGKVDLATWGVLGQRAATPVLTTPPPGDLRIIVDLKYLTLTVLVDNQPFASFPVAIGKRETPSPVGNWKLISKGVWSGGFGTRWLGLNVPFGTYGIHGTNKPWSIGRLASQGCVRMFNKDVEQLYHWVKIGTPVHIIGDPFMGRRRLVKGEKGSDVMFLQKRLRQLGYYDQKADGIYGYATEQAVKKFQAEKRLPVTGQVGWAEYQALGLFSEE